MPRAAKIGIRMGEMMAFPAGQSPQQPADQDGGEDQNDFSFGTSVDADPFDDPIDKSVGDTCLRHENAEPCSEHDEQTDHCGGGGDRGGIGIVRETRVLTSQEEADDDAQEHAQIIALSKKSKHNEDDQREQRQERRGRDQSPITKFHKKFSFLFSFAYVQVITIYRSNT